MGYFSQEGYIMDKMDILLLLHQEPRFISYEIPKQVAWVVKKIFGCRDTVMQAISLQGDLNHKLAKCQNKGQISDKKDVL